MRGEAEEATASTSSGHGVMTLNTRCLTTCADSSKRQSPMILDPADPTRNVAGSDLQAWELLADEAQFWLNSSFFRDTDMSPVYGWKVSPEKQGCVFL
ncbi:Inactive 2'-5'-oligoadenylate synthase 1D [Apodemus speciosus]|uniref:Inactive 2'-5'-oligoadenylate synthase 1D n=1 Tax=Apodemus speciosus TaxID=105296 RepID=A0ABQ0ESS7_APOSI